MKIRILPQAAQDFEQIYRHIAQDNPLAALKVSTKLNAAVQKVALNPYMGRQAYGNVREWSVTNLPYVIPYRIEEDTIEILRFFHTSRNRPRKWN